jgi:hypothetical protein
MTNVIKLQFPKSGEPQGREYTYYAPEGMELKPGDEVAIEYKKGVVSQVDVPVEEILKFGDKAQTIIGKMGDAPALAPEIERLLTVISGWEHCCPPEEFESAMAGLNAFIGREEAMLAITKQRNRLSVKMPPEEPLPFTEE